MENIANNQKTVGGKIAILRLRVKGDKLSWPDYSRDTFPYVTRTLNRWINLATSKVNPDLKKLEDARRQKDLEKRKIRRESYKKLTASEALRITAEERLEREKKRSENAFKRAEKAEQEQKRIENEQREALQVSIKKIQEKAVSKLHLSAKQAEKLVKPESASGSELESINLGSGSPPRIRSLFFSASSATTTMENSIAPSQSPYIDTKTPVNRSRADITGQTLNKMKNLILTNNKEKAEEMMEFIEAVSPALSLKVEVGGPSTLKPLITYHGSKSGEILKIATYIPTGWQVYVEPFVGGASMYLWLQPSTAVLNDKDETIINFYGQSKISGNFEKIGEELMKLECSKENYDDIR